MADNMTTMPFNENGTWDSLNGTFANGTNMVRDAYFDDLFELILLKISVPILFGIIALIGLIGNGLVIYVIFSRHRMRTVTNLLLLNLAFADLSFVVICPPFTAMSFALSQWPFGEFVCKLMHYLLNVTVYVTIYTLVLISIIRYMTILHNAGTVRYRTKTNIIILCAGIWVVMLIVNIPIILSHGVTVIDGVPDCDNYGPEIGKRIFATFFVFAYLLPLIIIAILSVLILLFINKQKPTMLDKKTKSEGKKKQASRLLVLVVVIFAIFWLPVHIHLLIAYFGKISTSYFYRAVSMFWNCLAYFNSCINPFIYNYASKEFRDAFREVVCCLNSGSGRHEGKTEVTRVDCNNAKNGETKRLVAVPKNVGGEQNECTDV